MLMREVALLIDFILNVLSEGKADKVVNIPLEGKSEQADNMVIASGTSSRHVSSISEKLISAVKKHGNISVKTEGLSNSDWVLIDCGDVIVHVFREEVRDFYQIERLWQYSSNEISELENL